MSELRILSEEELKKYGTTWSWSARAKALINQQKATWETAASHYRSLRQVESRWVDFGHFRICLQHNPGRIRSSAADTGAAALRLGLPRGTEALAARFVSGRGRLHVA